MMSKNKTKIYRGALMVVVIIVAAQSGRLIHSQLKARELRKNKPIPYAVVLKTLIHGRDGSTTEGFDITWAVRGDGSVVRQIVYREKLQDGKVISPARSERTLNFSSGVEVAINEMDALKTSVMTDFASSSRQRDPKTQCQMSMAGKYVSATKETFLGEENIGGYRTVKISRGNITEWFALDYGCAMVKDRWDFGGLEFTEKSLVSLSAGEPDPALFEIPVDAREVPPTERIRGTKQEALACSEATKKALRKLDDDYAKRRVTN